MAETKTLSGLSYSPAMDEKTHEQTYRGFIRFVEIGTVTVLCWVLALAIGGVHEAWITAIMAVLVSWGLAALGAFVPAIGWKAQAGLFLALLAVLFLS
ncbi:aa3-type cytochrome c oxidase subunit IV [Methylobacterium sp. Leaf118]|uniref:aa3-type cytochrome c oxidase subunit IV n=1 Tax=Methylobacterium sp. Leaf118 TaxID=2876562 RepID=UPI001E3E2630|nr:aa3-type cytochrome c oxidase subunit IV [Methylobacterium sp. Leaf118]